MTTVTVPDPSPSPYITIGAGTASVTYSGVVFSSNALIGNGYFYNIGPLYSGLPDAVLSDQNAGAGAANILITFPGQVTGFAVDFGTLAGGDVTLLLSNGDNMVLTNSGAGDYSTPNFIGLTDTTPFTSVLLTTTDYDLEINHASYASTPEPGTLGQLALGAIELLLLGAGSASKIKR